jgi:hypothetical protein
VHGHLLTVRTVSYIVLAVEIGRQVRQQLHTAEYIALAALLAIVRGIWTVHAIVYAVRTVRYIVFAVRTAHTIVHAARTVHDIVFAAGTVHYIVLAVQAGTTGRGLHSRSVVHAAGAPRSPSRLQPRCSLSSARDECPNSPNRPREHLQIGTP